MPSYSDSEMRAIVGRALQIDTGRSDRFTPEQLRTIAAELGISTQALEVAMYEADSKGRGLVAEARPRSGMPVWAKGVAIAVASVLVMVAGALLFGRGGQPHIGQVATPRAEQAVSAAPAAPARAEPVPVQPSPAPIAVKKPRATTKKQF